MDNTELKSVRIQFLNACEKGDLEAILQLESKVEGNDFYNGAPLLYSLWSKNSYLIDKFFPTCIGNFSRLCVLFRIACVTSQEHYITLFANEIHKLLPKSSDWNITLDNMKKIEQEVHFLKSKGLNKYIVLLT